jgi:hypothetical protein
LLFSTIVDPRTGARVLHPVRQADGEDQDVQRDLVVRAPRERDPRNAVDQQRDQDGGKRKLHVGDAHDECVHLAAGITGDEPERHAEHDGERDRREADEERNPRPEHDGREHVAPLVVGAEQEHRATAFHPRRRQQRVRQIQRPQVEGIVRGDEGREERAHDAQRKYREGDHRDRRMPEAPRDVAVPGRTQPRAERRRRDQGSGAVVHRASARQAMARRTCVMAWSCTMRFQSSASW